MANEVIGQVPSGVGNEKLAIEKIPNLQDRTKAIYWRPFKHPDGRIEWMPTLPLPADATGREQYLAKGFRLSDPSKEQEAEAATDGEKDTLKEELAELREQNRLLQELLAKSSQEAVVKPKHAGGRPRKAK